ncbi:MAG: ABC transporter permease, partial [Phycisphaerae bacterium]
GGLAATRAAEYAAGDVVIRIYHSPWGLQLAAISGIATTLLSAALLVIQVGRVGPLDAVNVQARPVRRRLIYAVSLFGAALLICFQAMISSADGTQWLDPLFAGAGTSALYLGFALAAPAMIVWLGRPMARGVGWMMRLQPGLAEDPFVRAPWRTTGACWVLMVGLSLIVYIAARAEGVLAVWDFPARLPEAFVWSPSYVSGETIERVRRLSGLVNTTVVTDVTCDIAKPGDERPSPARSLFETIVRQVTKPVFVAGDPDKLLGMIKVAFTEGSFDEAIVRLRRGGAVLIPTQTARNHDLHLGDRIAVTVKGRRAEFEIAGVVQSPALDLAVTAFQAQSYMQFAAASAILGTRRDLIDKFDLDVVSMFMFDMDLPATPMPEDFAQQMMQDMTDDLTATRLFLAWRDRIPEAADVYQRLGRPMTSWAENPKGFSLDADTAGEIERFARALQWTKHSSYTRDYTAEEKWTALRKRLLLAYVRRDMNAPKTVAGSLAHLKRQLEKGLRRAITVITWLPSLMLAVAAIGIANLMMVSVHARARQIAVLRALGALKSQIVRLVLAEAITVGLLGSVLGLALGLYETYSVNRIVAGLIDVSLDFIVPVGTIAAAVALTVTVCLLAAVAPARRAARNNIIQAIQTT